MIALSILFAGGAIALTIYAGLAAYICRLEDAENYPVRSVKARGEVIDIRI